MTLGEHRGCQGWMSLEVHTALAGESRWPSSDIAVDDGKGEYLVDVCYTAAHVRGSPDLA